MDLETSEPGAKARPGDLLGSFDPGSHSKPGPKKQGSDPRSPEVRVVRRGLSVFVWIDNAPWGMGHCRREFIGRRDTLANQYADALRGRLAALAASERQMRERKARARQQEREASIARLCGMAREAFG